MQPEVPLAPYLYALGGYLALQILLNALLRQSIARRKDRAVAMLTGTFWAGLANGLYFVAAAIVLNILGAAPTATEIPANFWWLVLAGLPAGAGLWYLSVQARKLGLALFGDGELIASEDAILRLPPHPRYITLGLVNQVLIQPLGREAFFRAALFPTVAAMAARNSTPVAGWLWAILIIIVLELMLRLNIVWVFQTLVYSITLCLLYLMTGSALTGLVAAMTAGALHGVALVYIGQLDLKRRVLELQQSAEGLIPDHGQDADKPGE